jgi:hypothetical protein
MQLLEVRVEIGPRAFGLDFDRAGREISDDSRETAGHRALLREEAVADALDAPRHHRVESRPIRWLSGGSSR